MGEDLQKELVEVEAKAFARIRMRRRCRMG